MPGVLEDLESQGPGVLEALESWRATSTTMMDCSVVIVLTDDRWRLEGGKDVSLSFLNVTLRDWLACQQQEGRPGPGPGPH